MVINLKFIAYVAGVITISIPLDVKFWFISMLMRLWMEIFGKWQTFWVGVKRFHLKTDAADSWLDRVQLCQREGHRPVDESVDRQMLSAHSFTGEMYGDPLNHSRSTGHLPPGQRSTGPCPMVITTTA